MPDRQLTLRCVHCLGTFDELTADHVFPKSWYPETTPANLEKWTVPACSACNKAYGRLEEDLLAKIALCLDPKSPSAKGITQRVVRSMDVRAGRDDRDAAARACRLSKIRADMHTFDQPPNEGVLPGLGPIPGLKYEKYVGVLVPQDDLRCIVLKIVRGLALRLDGVYLDGDLEIHCYPFEGDGEPWINDVLSRFGSAYEWGDGIKVVRAAVEGDPRASLTRVEFWQRFKFYGIVRPAESSGITFHGM